MELEKPLNERRAALVRGDREPTENECVGYVSEKKPSSASVFIFCSVAIVVTLLVKGIPGFWLQAMSNNETILQLGRINERDAKALAYLQNVSLEHIPRSNAKNQEGADIIKVALHCSLCSHRLTHLSMDSNCYFSLLKTLTFLTLCYLSPTILLNQKLVLILFSITLRGV